MSSQSAHLLPKSTASIKSSTEESNSPPISHWTSNCATAAAIVRFLPGIAILVAPAFTCRLFHIPLTTGTAIIARMVAIRDLAIAEMQLTAHSDQRNIDVAGGRRELKRSLWAGVAVDTGDVAVLAFGLVTGGVSKFTASTFGAGALVVLALQGAALKGL